MRVAYISASPFSDLDISQIAIAQKVMDVTYYIIVTPDTQNKAAINIKSLPKEFGIYCCTAFEELKKFNTLLDISKVYVINYTSSRSWKLQTFIQACKLYTHIKKLKYDVIHFTWPFRYCEFFMYLLRRKMVLTVHDPFPHSSHSSKLREFERKTAFKLINNLILLNSAQKDDFLKYYKLHDKNILVSRLSRYDYLKVYENKNTPQTDTILFFGYIYSYKGLEYLLPAMDIVHRKYPQMKLIIAGNGKMYFDITPYMHQDYIEFRNRYIPDEELAELIQQCRFVVLPYTDATQSGVIMSAFAFDKPCVVTDVGGLPEMVIHEKFGLIVPPKDIKSLSDAMCKLLDNSNVLKEYSNNIKTEYDNGSLSWKCIVNELYSMYLDISKNN